MSYDALESFVNEISIMTDETTVDLMNLEEGIQYLITVEALFDNITCGSAEINATTDADG